MATYGPPAAGIRATIPVTVPASRLSAAPRTMTFGSHAIGTMSTQLMTITNVSDDTMSITGVIVTGHFPHLPRGVQAERNGRPTLMRHDAPGPSVQKWLSFGSS